MARLARGEYLDPQTIQIVHATSRCVRRAFLCGNDPYSGKCYEHRREWIRERLEFLASIFAVDCLTFAVMSNHIHLILRNRPDIVRSWSDEEVAGRWLRLCSPRCNGNAVEPTQADVAMLLSDPRKIAELRIRLSDISWWMRMTGQKIAQLANREDRCTGRFWEGRYKAQILLDEAAILACAMYVDLNPIRATLAQSLEDSEFTGAKARIDDMKDSGFALPENSNPAKSSLSKRKTNGGSRRRRTQRWERSRGRQQSGWLSPVEVCETGDPTGTDPSPCSRRASLKGFLSLPLVRYLELLDWSGRQLRRGKRGAIPPGIAPILERLGIRADRWFDLTQQFGSLFRRAAGTKVALASEAAARGQNWLQAPGAPCLG